MKLPKFMVVGPKFQVAGWEGDRLNNGIVGNVYGCEDVTAVP